MALLRRPGWPWLMLHELRLDWRAVGGGRAWILLGLGGALYALAHYGAWIVLSRSTPEQWLASASPGYFVLEAVAGLVVLSMAFGLAVRTLFFRGDLDLLLSAPVAAVTVFAVRAVFVALRCVALVALLVSPFIHAGVLLGRWHMLLAYPALAAFGLACAAVAFAATLALARRLGVRRARIAAQVLGALIGATLAIGVQLPNALPAAGRERVLAWLGAHTEGWFGPDSVMAWPLRALAGEPPFALGAVVAGVALFGLMLPMNWRGFLDAVQRADDAGRREEPSRAAAARARLFRTGLARIVVAKELKLLLRDPMLVGSSLVQVLYLVPLLIVVWNRGATATAQLLGPGVVLLLANLCGSLAWICVSAEEAPDLVRAAPVESWRVNFYKASAAALGPALIGLPFVGWYLVRSARDGLAVALFLALALWSSAAIQLWSARAVRARDLALRRKDRVGINLLEMLTAFGWAAACHAAIRGSLAVLGGIAVAIAGLALAHAVRPRSDD